MAYATFEIKDGNLHLNNEHSAAAEPSDIDIYLDSDNFAESEYGGDLIDIGDNW